MEKDYKRLGVLLHCAQANGVTSESRPSLNATAQSYFGPPVEDLNELVKMNPKKDFAEATQGCKKVKSYAKHRTRKS